MIQGCHAQPLPCYMGIIQTVMQRTPLRLGDGAEAGPRLSRQPRLAGLDGSPTSDVSSVADEPARSDTHRLARRPGSIQSGQPEGRVQRAEGRTVSPARTRVSAAALSWS